MIGDGGDLGYVLNGKGFPATEPMNVKEGERVRVRFIGTGVMTHPMHLHGHVMKVIAREDAPLTAPYETDTVTVSPGESWDVEFTADNPGDWPLHCHILPHAETKDGMYGLTMLLHYEK
jgi:FtsP/CotA-like multicopper oxidase with cupredoxin domain